VFFYSYNYAGLLIDANGYTSFGLETDWGEEWVTYSDPLPLKEWVHIAATWSANNTMKIYVNGSLRAKGVVQGGSLSATGATRPRIGEGLNGKIDEVHVRNTVDTDFAANLYTDYSVTADTLGLWHLNETSGTIAYDADTGNPQNADLRGNAAWGSGANDYGIPHYLHQYTYDKVGNRTKMVKSWAKGTPPGFERWKMEYNNLNQLVKRYSGTSWTGANNDYRFEYQYDANGNLTLKKQEKKTSGVWNQEDKLECKWNPRNQLARAISYGSGANNVGSVDYQYCLSCDGALSVRMQYAAGTGADPGALTSHRRYEYDGLNLLRIDELCDANGNGTIDAGETTWRKVEVSTHKPGSIGTLLAKRIYSYPTAGNRCVSNGNTNYAYTYDAVGNVFCVLNSSGGEAYRFSQDAFGNSISIGDFTGSDWTTARNAGITEHQTGKWIDPLTGMYYFSSRWYDPVVGRFVGRDPQDSLGQSTADLTTLSCSKCGGCKSSSSTNNTPWFMTGYNYCENDPVSNVDPTGEYAAFVITVVGGIGVIALVEIFNWICDNACFKAVARWMAQMGPEEAYCNHICHRVHKKNEGDSTPIRCNPKNPRPINCKLDFKCYSKCIDEQIFVNLAPFTSEVIKECGGIELRHVDSPK